MAEDTPNAVPAGGEPTAPDPAPAAVAPTREPSAAPQATAPAEAAAPTADAAATTDAEAAASSAEAANLDSLDQFSIEELLKQANFEDPSAAAAGGTPASGGESPAAIPGAEPFQFPGFQQAMQDAQVSSIELLRDVELNVKIELGRSRMLVEDVLKLAEGSVVELDKLAGDPVDVFVNERLVARGEVLVLNDNFCVRVNEIVPGVKDEGL
jgi:flagellar motor switch protein FliN/FliY